MDRELRRIPYYLPAPYIKRAPMLKASEELPKIDITIIRAVRFYYNLMCPKNTFFVTSLYEIDQIIKEKE